MWFDSITEWIDDVINYSSENGIFWGFLIAIIAGIILFVLYKLIVWMF